jgi:hypothetical protein
MLGESETDVVVRNILDSARSIFPVQTAEAEAWINARLADYGISYARYQAERMVSVTYPWLQNPLVWIVGAWIVWKIFK